MNDADFNSCVIPSDNKAVSEKCTSAASRHYVLGFLFGENPTRRIALIRKNKPEWQKGLLNGIGGKVESGESPYSAMVREFHEETGVRIERGWLAYCTMRSANFQCDVFKVTDSDALLKVATTTDEEVVVVFPHAVLDPKPWLHRSVSNVPWLIAMAMDDNCGGKPFFANINYEPTT